MKILLTLWIILFSTLLIPIHEAKTIDPYKVLGVERNASQREIQKAFHKLSLQYHPDKNKNKGAQEKFAEINNAYDILSDEEKRKNYDTYGDEKGNPGFDAGRPGEHDQYTYFTGGGPGQNQFKGGPGGSQSFSFSFGGPSGPSSFDFDMSDILSGFFGRGSKDGGQFGGFSGSTRSHSGPKDGGQFGGFSGSTRFQSQPRSSPKSIKVINSQVFGKEIADQGMTWILLSYVPSLKGNQYYESVIEEAASSLQGALKVGSINCETESSLCKDLDINPRRTPRVFVYSYRTSGKGSLVEYSGDMVAKNLKTFCQDHLPRFSKRVNLDHFEFSSGTVEKMPRLLLLSTKRNTPAIWRVLSGLYHKSFIFYDAEVYDVSDQKVKKLGVDALPSIVGWLSNGEKHVLRAGISVKDLESAVHDLSKLLDSFAKKNKKTVSNKAGNAETDSPEKQIPLLTGLNFDALCGEETPVCIMGAFRSSRGREKLESVMSTVSKKSLSRQQNSVSGSKNSLSYVLLDANRQSSFLHAFEKSGFKSSDTFLVAYKPRKRRFAAFTGEMTAEEVERFISSVFSGDIQFTNSGQQPTVK
ncbi:DnaJ domain-containing protein [Cephalotus follicularis]|uniref:DnaJ domain-containing protein n=1 Tax=Cephalotus follicularis TaxID=3775 RepID=A0A1Q3C0D1_CEPFO|nr:DnaJ domain-containing protein [Cephalotus follicularis]